MKKRLPTFLAGMLTAALIGGLGVTALAAAGQMTITVDPISIQVNGQTFQPKNAKGNDVPVFSLNGTTYAPLRALAEAYGLTVGYDQAANMATVTDPNATPTPEVTPSPDYSTWSPEDEAAYQLFKGMWEVKLNQEGLQRDQDKETTYLVTANFKGSDINSIKTLWNSMDPELRANFVVRLSREFLSDYEPKIFAFIEFNLEDSSIATIELDRTASVQMHNIDEYDSPPIIITVD